MKRHQLGHTVMALVWVGMAIGFMGSLDYGLLSRWAAFGLGTLSVAFMGLHVWAAETIRKMHERREEHEFYAGKGAGGVFQPTQGGEGYRRAGD